MAAGELNADVAARVAGIFSQESDFELDPAKWGNDTGPAQLTGAVFKYWPWAVTGRPFGDRQVIKKTGEDKGKPAVDKSKNFNSSWFSQDILDNMATMRNIVMSYGSDYDAAFAYGPGPDSEREKYAKEVTARTPQYKIFFQCLLK